jgi:hypothetical protein
MWFYVPAIIVVALFAWWLSRTSLYRHFRRGSKPEETGPAHPSKHWEGDSGTSGLGAG